MRKRTSRELAVGFWKLAHAERIVVILAAVALFAVRATWPHPPWATILVLLSEGFHRQPFVDLAVVFAPMSLVGSLVFARLMERRL